MSRAIRTLRFAGRTVRIRPVRGDDLVHFHRWWNDEVAMRETVTVRLDGHVWSSERVRFEVDEGAISRGGNPRD